jgi:hypothetical protein
VAVFAAAKGDACGLADLQRDIGCDLAVSSAPDSVSAEIFARHA